MLTVKVDRHLKVQITLQQKTHSLTEPRSTDTKEKEKKVRTYNILGSWREGKRALQTFATFDSNVTVEVEDGLFPVSVLSFRCYNKTWDYNRPSLAKNCKDDDLQVERRMAR